MAKIQQYLDNIKNALFGREVRSSIHDGIDAINKEVERTTAKQEHLDGTFNQLIINSGTSNAEIVDARVEVDGTQHDKLGDRLDASDKKIDIHFNMPHVTYFEINESGNPISQNILATHENKSLLTNDNKGIIANISTRSNVDIDIDKNIKNTISNNIKINDLPNAKPTDNDKLIIETKNGTSSTSVSDLLGNINLKYKQI